MSHPPPTRSVFITGASSGIGEACALRLARGGWRVFAGVRKQADAEALLAKTSSGLTPLIMDVTDPMEIAQAAEAIAQAVGEVGLGGLVNNAGIAQGGPLEFLNLDDLRHALEVNLIGVVAVTQALLPLLRLAGGRIVNISSLSGLFAMPFIAPYTASKFALEAVSDSLRVELRPWGIWVAVVEPGDINTPIWDKSLAVIDGLAQNMPQRGIELYGPVLEMRERFIRHGIPAERVAEVVEHALTAARPKARYTVGGDAKAVTLLRLLPVRLRDWLIASQTPKYP